MLEGLATYTNGPQEAADLINRVLDRDLVLGLERFGAGMDCVLAEYLKRRF